MRQVTVAVVKSQLLLSQHRPPWHQPSHGLTLPILPPKVPVRQGCVPCMLQNRHDRGPVMFFVSELCRVAHVPCPCL